MPRSGVSPAARRILPAGDPSRPRARAGEEAPQDPLRRRFLESHPWFVDSVVALIYTVPLLISRSIALAQGSTSIGWWHLAAIVLTGAALLFRRHRPLLVLAIVSLLSTVLTWSLDADNELLAVPIALYAVAVYRSIRLAWIAGGAAVLVAAAGLQLWSPFLLADPDGDGAGDELNLLALFTVSCLVALLIGVAARGRSERLRALVERTEQLARERDNNATIAALAERSRIAREMHDIVAHSLSVMVALADGAAVALDRDPGRARHALEQLSGVGRTALGDMQRVLAVLADGSADDGARSGDATDVGGADRGAGEPGSRGGDGAAGGTPGTLQPTPGYRELAELVDRFRTAGLPLRWSVTGAPVADPALELSVYRIAQEALTNVLRYAAAPTVVELSVEHGPGGITVTVTDDGGRAGDDAAGPADVRTSVGSRRGIVGMAERAAMHGGAVEAGPLVTGGWRVRAVLPSGANAVGSRR